MSPSTLQIHGEDLAVEPDVFDLDIEVGIETVAASPAITSWSLCTPGCTSAGGGSNCSFCC